MDYLKDQNSINSFVKSYEVYIGTKVSNEEVAIVGTPEHIAHSNIGYYLSWRQTTGPKLEMWNNAINRTEQAP